MTILTENRDKLDILTEALLEFETLEGSQVVDILEYGVMKNPPEKVTPPPMPSDVEEEEKKEESGAADKKNSEEDRKDKTAENRDGEDKAPDKEQDPFSYNPVEDYGSDREDKN